MDDNLLSMLEKTIARYPNRVAISFGTKRVLYKELADNLERLAFKLQALGVNQGDKVALWLPNCPEFVYSFFAVLKLKAVVVPINTMFKHEEARYILEDSQAKIVICSIDKLADCESILSRIEKLEHIVSLPAPYTNINDVVIDFYQAIASSPALKQEVSVDGDAIAQIIYTSGTTGHPKGACLSHRNLLSNVEDCAKVMKFSKHDAILCILPLFHSFASTVCMLLPLSKGAKIVVMRAVRPFKRVVRTIFKQRITVFVGIPSIYSILTQAHFTRLQLFLNFFINPVRACISGAAALPVEVTKKFERRFRRPLIQGYGLTEASPVVSLNPFMGKRKPESVGMPIPTVRVKIVGKDGQVLPTGEVGELLVKGPNVMRGYFNRQEETESTLQNYWLHTGDLAKFDQEGYIYIMGRIKDMINVRGLNVYPREIEDLLYSHPLIKEASVVGVMHRHRGEVPIAFVVKTAQVESQELVKYLRANLAPYKVPLKIFFRESLPKNSTGKILKRVLQEEVEHVFQ